MMFKKLYLILAVVGLSFFGCKKYPENTVWFKNPQNFFKGGVITEYTFDGVDHLKDIKDLYHNFPYNFYGTKIENALDLPFTYTKSGDSFSSDYGEGLLIFSPTKKNVELSFKPKNSEYGAQNIFLGYYSWKILKLTKSGQLKIQAYINLKTVVIQFN